MKYLIVIALMFFSFMFGLYVQLNKKTESPHIPLVPNRENFIDSLLEARAHNHIEYIKQDSIIYETKTKLKDKFIAVDSLSYDSAYVLWTIEASKYQPNFNY